MMKGAQHIECAASRLSGEDGDNDPDETAYNLNIQRWQKQLNVLFG